MYQQLILVYYNFRGLMQPIRNLLCYLRIQFYQIHMERFEAQRPSIPPDILSRLKGLKIDRSQLPILVHEGLTISEPYAIMRYICLRFDREYLFGETICEKARIAEILQIYFNRQPQSMIELFTIADESVNASQETVRKIVSKTYDRIIFNSGYIKEICDILRSGSQYVFDQITVIDFLFVESCFYLNGVLENLDAHSTQHAYYTKTIKEYVKFVMNEPFYRQNKDFLESFSIVSGFLRPERIQGLRNAWKGNPKAVK